MSQTPTYLDRILASHREVASHDERDLEQLVQRCVDMSATRGFGKRLIADANDGISVISEIKRRSPSKGDLAEGLDAELIAVAY